MEKLKFCWICVILVLIFVLIFVVVCLCWLNGFRLKKIVLVFGVLVNCSVLSFGKVIVQLIFLVFILILFILWIIVLVCVSDDFFGIFMLLMRYSLFWVGINLLGMILNIILVVQSSSRYIVNIVLWCLSVLFISF